MNNIEQSPSAIPQEPRFGENFTVDGTNRLNPLQKTELPPYVQSAREVRGLLRESLAEQGWPECPEEIKNPENFFTSAKTAVTQRWTERASRLLETQCGEWADALPADGEYGEIKQILTDPERLRKMLEIRQFGALEPLRKVLPGAWRCLVLLSSERQLAEIVLLRRWTKDISDERLKKLGISRPELELFLETAGLLGKFADHAYVKQIELADSPGGSSESKLRKEKGAECVYDLYQKDQSDEVKLLTYKEVFPFEFGRLDRDFQELKRRTEKRIREGTLPESYKNLPAYLEALRNAYSSEETDPGKLDTLWTALKKLSGDLAKEGCPLMFVPQRTPAVAGDANKVDVEIRLGIRTENTQTMEAEYRQLTAIAQGILEKNKEALGELYQIPFVIPNFQYAAFGPNTYWATRGEESPDIILTHANAVSDVALAKEIPLLRKIFAGETIDPNEYAQGAMMETGLHEIAHTIMSREDKKVRERTGSSSESSILEELKAETMAMALLDEQLKQRESAGENTEAISRARFLAKLGTVLDYLANKSDKAGGSGERYFCPGAAMIKALFDAKVLAEKDGKYSIQNPRQGIATLAAMGQSLLQDFYVNQGDVKAEGDRLRGIKNDPQVKSFLEMLKA